MRRPLAVLAVALSASASAVAGDIRILTDPEGAEVAQGSVRLGVTTKEGLRVVGVDAGIIVFTITKEGFETVTRSVSVESTIEPVTILVRLRPATTGAPEATPTTANQDATASPVTPKTEAAPKTAPAPKQKGGSKTALIILGGAAVVGGGVALAAGHGSATTTTTTTLPRAATLADLSAKVTSPQKGAALNCNEPAFFTVSLTNAAPALVFVTGVRLHTSSVVGDCFGPQDFTYTVTNSQVGTGTANVLTNQTLFTGGVGCCVKAGCSGFSCNFQYSFTVLTSVGEVSAGPIDFGVVFNGCAVCRSVVGFGAAGFSATSCPAKP